MLTTLPEKEAGMEKWSAQESDRTLVLGYWAGCNGLYVWVHIIGRRITSNLTTDLYCSFFTTPARSRVP